MIDKKIFEKEWKFIAGASNMSHLPKYRNPEFAFIGASNVGKSSIINMITNQKIAIASSTPGRTRQLNFFCVDATIPAYPVIVDMPGYGYARAHKLVVENWQKLAVEYLTRRTNLKRVFLLIDAVKSIKKADLEIFDILTAVAAPFQVVITKIDKIKKEELVDLEQEIMPIISKFAAAHPVIIRSSAERKIGNYEIRDSILSMI